VGWSRISLRTLILCSFRKFTDMKLQAIGNGCIQMLIKVQTNIGGINVWDHGRYQPLGVFKHISAKYCDHRFKKEYIIYRCQVQSMRRVYKWWIHHWKYQVPIQVVDGVYAHISGKFYMQKREDCVLECQMSCGMEKNIDNSHLQVVM